MQESYRRIIIPCNSSVLVEIIDIFMKNAQKKCENNNFIVKNITFLVAKRRVCYGRYSIKT